MPIFIFYKIVCKDENINDCYVGKTKDLKRRWYSHKSRYYKEKNNLKLYQFIRENGGWNNFNMIEIEKNEYDDKDSAIREKYWVKELNATLNCQIPSRTQKEILKEYYENNKEKLKEIHKEWYENNKERKKDYYENNKEKLKEIHKEYYHNNKEKIKEINKEIIICECGCEITKKSLTRHKKTKKHIDLMI